MTQGYRKVSTSRRSANRTSRGRSELVITAQAGHHSHPFVIDTQNTAVFCPRIFNNPL